MHIVKDQTDVLAALDAILKDEKFVVAPQMSAFIQYVVKRTLAGEGDRIKAYTVAVDALGKPESFDPQKDPSVRVLAKRLRSNLELYYERTTGHKVIIELKAGSYKPNFVQCATNDFSASNVTVLPSCNMSLTHDAEITPSDGARDGEVFSSLNSPRDNEHTPADPSEESVSHSKVKYLENNWLRQLTANSKSACSLKNTPRLFCVLAAMTVLTWIIWDRFPLIDAKTAQIEKNSAALDKLPLGHDQSMHLKLASNIASTPARNRPELPTVFLAEDKWHDTIENKLTSTISNVLSRFNTLNVVRMDRDNAVTQYWPEEYTLSLRHLIVDDRLKVDMQLLQAKSGRLAYSESFMLDSKTAEFLSNGELDLIEIFAARLAQLNGPLMNDYNQHVAKQNKVGCTLDVWQHALPHHFNNNAREASLPNSRELEAMKKCIERLANNGSMSDQRLIMQSAQQLQLALKASATTRKVALEKSLALARKAVEISPFKAITHYYLMCVLQEVGDLESAINEGIRAVQLNPYSSKVLYEVSALMQTLKRNDEAEHFRKRAMRVDVMNDFAALPSS